VAKGAAALTAAGATRQKQLTALQASITLVRSVAGKASTNAAPTPTEAAAAVTAAQAQLKTEAAALAALRASTADGLARARSMETTAAGIYAKAC
jgi:hypothetical protein